MHTPPAGNFEHPDQLPMSRSLFTLPVLLMISQAIAQPTITSGSLSFVPGDQFMRSNCDTIDPGPAGAAQSWNFTGLTGCDAPLIDAWVAPIGGSDPYITVVEQGVGIIRTDHHAGPGAFELVGYYDDPQNGETYIDPEDLVRYPMDYTDSYTDTYNGDKLIANVAHTFTGTRTVTYDGWGSITVPWGTVASVYRLHSHDSLVVAGPNGYTDVSDQYDFIQPGLKEPILRARTAFYDNGGFSFHYGLSYLYIPGGVGTMEVAPAVSVVLFPNPAEGSITIHTGWSSIERLEILDASGRIVHAATQLPGRVTLDLRDRVTPGLYQVGVQSGAIATIQRIIIQ